MVQKLTVFISSVSTGNSISFISGSASTEDALSCIGFLRDRGARMGVWPPSGKTEANEAFLYSP